MKVKVWARDGWVDAADRPRAVADLGRRDRIRKYLPPVADGPNMALYTLGKLLKLGLITVGLATLVFVFVSYGWNGEPPTVELE